MTSIEPVRLTDIHDVLRRLGGFYSVYIPEFTFNGLRIDALVLDVSTRWARGFEVKMSRSDFLRDEKWHLYSQFCSSLSIVCPAELIKKEEVGDPFGLLYVYPESSLTHDLRNISVKWIKKPKRFQKRESMAWIWRYVEIIEKELPRLVLENERLRKRLTVRKES